MAGHGKVYKLREVSVKTVTVSLKSVSAYSASAAIDMSQKLDKESHDAFENRVWNQRLNVMPDGVGCIPAMAFTKGLVAISKLLQETIKGKKGQTWTKHFTGGVLVTEPLVLPVTRATVIGEKVFVPSDGKSGGGSRVWKTFPVVPKWSGDVTAYIINDTITPDVFEKYFREMGNLVGVGRFRPERGGFYGRFAVESFKWK